MKKGYAYLLMFLSVLFIPVMVQAALLWPLQVGQEYVFSYSDSTGDSGTYTLTVSGTTTIDSQIYFTFLNEPTFSIDRQILCCTNSMKVRLLHGMSVTYPATCMAVLSRLQL